MVILGIDPGTTRIGFGVIEKKKKQLFSKNYGCIFLEKEEEEKRILEIYKKIEEILKKENPDVVSIEKVFFSKNKKTAMAVSEARGVIKLAALKRGVVVKNYTPNEVKRSISTHGQADKKEVQKMVKLILNLKEEPKPDDAADALAIAVCAAGEIYFNNTPKKA